ncbi:serine/threonine-protein kinase [Streptomyces puniciscabiei]|uniref:serine/threonine-protein kinase n=1 Tax=Streptomyces puniciscabiei TaxID=164348 RepID=UPI003333EEDB
MSAPTADGPGPAPLVPGTQPAPGYAILAHLARTGWLDVYDAWSEERACRCVIKVVRPDRRREQGLGERLLREGRWLREFSHPHLVRGYETVESPEPLVVLETLTGETLSHLVHRLRRRPAAADVALLGVQLCSAVHYLHGRGLLHLDLKPSNVVVDRGHAKVLDLSVARPPGPAPAGVGTYGYLAPEQARGGPLTAAADVWGIGVTLYEVASGDTPFGRGASGDAPVDRRASGDAPVDRRTSGDAPVDRRTSGDAPVDRGSREDEPDDGGEGADGRYPQLAGPAPPIASRRRLPPALAAAVDACLRADPARRPTIGELAAALRRTLPRGP